MKGKLRIKELFIECKDSSTFSPRNQILIRITVNDVYNKLKGTDSMGRTQ